MTPNFRCPICNGQAFAPYLTVKDHTVSQETFTLVSCTTCHFLFTDPVPQDLGRYYESPNYISHSNSASNLTDILYKFARTATLRWKTNLINYYRSASQRTLLDYGCGTGAFLSHAKKTGWQISGVEPARGPREAAAAATQTVIASTLEELSGDPVGTITLWHVLEHIPNLHQVLDALYATLRDDGTIFIAVPNHSSFDAKYYQQHWAAYDTPRHLWHFRKNDMTTLLEKHAFTLHAVIPMKLDAFYVSMLSEKYRSDQASGTTSLLRGLLTGFRSNLAAVSSKEYSSLIYIARK